MPLSLPVLANARKAAYTFAIIAMIFLLAVLGVSIAACVVNNWLTNTIYFYLTSGSYVSVTITQGLWNYCISGSASVTGNSASQCVSINNANSLSSSWWVVQSWSTTTCTSMLQAVQAFTIMTICSSFITGAFLTIALLWWSKTAGVFTLVWSILTVCVTLYSPRNDPPPPLFSTLCTPDQI